MKAFGKIVASAGALVLVGTLTLGAVSYAWAQDSQDSNDTNATPTTQMQQRWGNGGRFADGPMGWFAQRFGERVHNWMSQRMGDGPMQGIMGRMDGRMGNNGMMGGAFGQGGEMLTVVAKSLDMSEADVRTALVDGKSVADLATEKGVDLQTIINTLMLDRKAQLDEAVAAGTLTQERADQMLTMMAQMIPEHLNQPVAPGNGMMGSGLRWGPGFERGFNMLSTVATVLDMPEADVLSAVRDGKTIAAIAEAQGVDLQKVTDAILAERTTQLDEAVAAGTITQARADLMLENMKASLPDHLNQTMGQGMGMNFQGMGQNRMFGAKGGMRGGMHDGMHQGQGFGPMWDQDDTNQDDAGQ